VSADPDRIAIVDVLRHSQSRHTSTGRAMLVDFHCISREYGRLLRL
jgi:hypothetical protein